jgi:hypothetical protein
MLSLTRVVRDLVVPPARNGGAQVALGAGLRALGRVALSPLGAVPRAAARLPELIVALGSQGQAIPVGRRRAPDPGLALRALGGYLRGDADVRAGYLSILTAAMDSAVAGNVHPAFLGVLGQLGGDEMRLLASLDGDGPHPLLNVSSRLQHGGGSRVELRNFSVLGARAGCARPDLVPAYLDNLGRLGLIEIRPTRVTDDVRMFQELEDHPDVKQVRARIEAQPAARLGPISEPIVADIQYRSMFITAFGRQFKGACAYRPDLYPPGPTGPR